jgi:hypothetical protein
MCLFCFEHSWHFCYKQLCLLTGTVIRLNYKTGRWNANCKDLLFRNRMVGIMKCWSSINLLKVAMVSSCNCSNFVCFSFLKHVTVHLLFKMFNDEQSTGNTTYSIVIYVTVTYIWMVLVCKTQHGAKIFNSTIWRGHKVLLRFPLTHFLNTLRLPHIISKIGGVAAIVIRNTVPIGNKLHNNFDLTQSYGLKCTTNKTRTHTLHMLHFEDAEAHISLGGASVHPTSESLMAVTQTYVVTEGRVFEIRRPQ